MVIFHSYKLAHGVKRRRKILEFLETWKNDDFSTLVGQEKKSKNRTPPNKAPRRFPATHPNEALAELGEGVSQFVS